ncbi:unnamed protein product, partial [Heterosigma akashiwo]
HGRAEGGGVVGVALGGPEGATAGAGAGRGRGPDGRAVQGQALQGHQGGQAGPPGVRNPAGLGGRGRGGAVQGRQGRPRHQLRPGPGERAAELLPAADAGPGRPAARGRPRGGDPGRGAVRGAGHGGLSGRGPGAVNPCTRLHPPHPPARGEAKKKVALIGKGLTFDSGGYNIKAGAGSMIEMMKFDMGGSAATLGAARAVGALKPAGVEVHFIVAACENMVSDKAMRRGTSSPPQRQDHRGAEHGRGGPTDPGGRPGLRGEPRGHGRHR